MESRSKYIIPEQPGDESGCESDSGTQYGPSDSSKNLNVCLNLKFCGILTESFNITQFRVPGCELDYYTYLYVSDEFLHVWKNYESVAIPLDRLGVGNAHYLKNPHIPNESKQRMLKKHQAFLLEVIQESPGGYRIYKKGYINAGSFCYARMFCNSEKTKSKIVLAPKSDIAIDGDELRTKGKFYLKHHGPRSITMYCAQYPYGDINTYRIVLNNTNSISFDLLASDLTVSERIKIFVTALDEVLRCHEQSRLVYLDLKPDNIQYNIEKNVSYLIDGGLATEYGSEVPEQFICDNAMNLAKNKRHYKHIAPECWTIYGQQRAYAAFSMDVYSLVQQIWCQLITDRHVIVPQELREILALCLHEDTTIRPTLPILREAILRHEAACVYALRDISATP